MGITGEMSIHLSALAGSWLEQLAGRGEEAHRASRSRAPPSPLLAQIHPNSRLATTAQRQRARAATNRVRILGAPMLLPARAWSCETPAIRSGFQGSRRAAQFAGLASPCCHCRGRSPASARSC